MKKTAIIFSSTDGHTAKICKKIDATNHRKKLAGKTARKSAQNLAQIGKKV